MPQCKGMPRVGRQEGVGEGGGSTLIEGGGGVGGLDGMGVSRGKTEKGDNI